MAKISEITKTGKAKPYAEQSTTKETKSLILLGQARAKLVHNRLNQGIFETPEGRIKQCWEAIPRQNHTAPSRCLGQVQRLWIILGFLGAAIVNLNLTNFYAN